MRTIDADALKDEIWRVIDAQPTIEPEPHWIPCDKRLPDEEKKTYWVCTDSGYQCQCRWTNVNHFWTNLTTDWHWHIMDVPQHTEVVAWKLLSKPWRGENNGAKMRGGE